LLREKWTDAGQIAEWRGEGVQEIDTAIAQVQREPVPDPFAEKWTALSTERLIEGRMKNEA
jgi:hypothetical protein